MDEGTADRIIGESLRTGAARIVRDGGPLSGMSAMHHDLLRAFAGHVQDETLVPAAREAAWERIVEGTSSLVFSISRTYFRKWRSHLPDHASFDDVFNAGLAGLVVAVNKYDASHDAGARLTTYATPWIRNHVQRACYAQCGAAHIPEHVLQAGLDPRSDLVASATASLEEPSELDGGLDLGEIAVGSDGADRAMVDAQSLAQLVCLLRSIDEQMPEVADMLEQGYAASQIAEATGLTVARVKQLRGEARIVLKAHGY